MIEHIDCETLRDLLIAAIDNPAALHKRLRRMGAAEYFIWISEHMDEITPLMNNPSDGCQEASLHRRDLLLYGGALLCNVARKLLESLKELGLEPHNGTSVATLGWQGWRIGRVKAAPWPWDGLHPFASD